MSRVNFRKDFRDCYLGQGKKMANGELKERGRRRQRERQKSNRFRSANNNSGRASSFFFLHFFAVATRLRDVEMPSFTFCGGRGHKTMSFFFFSLTSITSF